MNAREGSREVIFNPANKEKIEHAVIWLHGLGATADDFPPVVPYLGLDQQRAIRFVFPQAPSRPISINGGMVMPGWYDIAGTSIGDKEDRHGMQESQAMLEALIAEQIELGIPSNKLIAAGFSQGGAVAYYTALRSKHRLAGVLALSTYLPFATQAAEEQSKVNVDTPIFAAHGEIDPMVPVQMGKTSVDALQSLGYKVAWKTYPMAHEVNMDELKDIGSWINQLYAGRL
ncbi:MAG: dienelactone hydrolase family protein [Gammaproteobacteria bacterium]|nr:dienelactone hydrolase family protein [Gammaproteobacteria bacterium]NND39492.1 carboxylesterase [Pseudomonadales bacterium]NNL10709.1 carboxylesterase [Pseudomonadales bacterium]NNM10699.1 carboxylesterase [Pseudomonadales bacterium]RZV55029.1 MAG: carboxylesterase [Pseudomonadales bacterium]